MPRKLCSLFERGRNIPATLLLLLAWPVVVTAQSSTIEIGAGYNSVDSFQFGQYTGITQRGEFAVGGFSLQNQADATDNRYWHATGKDLGLETASLAATYGRWGDFSVSVNYDQIPHYRFNDGRTPFNGSGSPNQRLPSNWVGAGSTAGLTALSSNLKQVNIDTNRERFSAGIEWRLSDSWQLLSEFRHETKQGNAPLGAIFGSTGGNPRGSIVSRPIDYQIDDVTLAVSYANRKSQYTLSYNAMLFSNKDKALLFANPFNNAQWAAGANFSDGAIGQMALEPDNTSSQLSLSGAHSFSGSSRVSASVVATRLEQDDSFLPYSNVLAAPTPLPRRDLNGQVDSLVAILNYSTRLSRRSSLRLRYNFRDRDNKTPQDIYLRIPGDAAAQGGLLTSQARINRTYDLQRNTFGADVNYRFSGKTRLAVGYEYEETDRSMVDVATTEEDTGFVKVNFSPSITSSGSIKLSRSERDASQYDSTVPFIAGHNPDYVATLVGNQLFENDPLLRRYHLTARDRNELSANLNFFPSGTLGVSFLALLADDEYPDARIGLQESEKRSFATDLSYSPATDWTASIYYNYDTYRNYQAGYARRGGADPTPFFPESVRIPANNWSMRSEDDVHSIGAGIDWALLAGQLELSIDGNYSDAQTETEPFSSGTDFLPLPDITTEISTLSLKGNYQLQPGRELSIGYYYQRYQSEDWALDEAGVSSLSNILLLGNESPEYSGHIFTMSLIFSLQ